MKLVLIVDDSRFVREAFSNLLRSVDIECEHASSGEEALARLDRDPLPDAILLDHLMAGIDGIEVCRILRNDPRFEMLPIFFTSGSDDASLRIRAYQAGADGFLNKSVHPEEVRCLLQAVTRRGQFRQYKEKTEELEKTVRLLELSNDQLIQSWVRALDLRDNESETHSIRTAQLTLKLAEHLGIPEETRTHWWRGAILHDIGKIGIPDAILHKPGGLTDDERLAMEKHTDYAYELLKDIEFLAPCIDIPRYHHEKWDGTGYPGGLSGEEIPLAARVFSVIDVYDALVSRRPYKEGWPVEQALEKIESMAGSHFDPDIAIAFCEMMRAHLELQQAA